jgi:hypothetical protein
MISLLKCDSALAALRSTLSGFAIVCLATCIAPLIAAPTAKSIPAPGAEPDLTRQQDYVMRHSSSADPTGGNNDYRPVPPGGSLTLLDADGPGSVSHVWITIADEEIFHLKRIVLRMYWDGEDTPSVEAPIGDFFGLGLGEYNSWQSRLLSVGSWKALNSFFPMPFAHHARITITNEGEKPILAFYYNIDYRSYAHALPQDTLYFHAQYRQRLPNDPNAPGNLTWLEATGHGHYIGVTMSVLQNGDRWWGEGDDMFHIDGETKPSIAGTGSEDYFLGAWDFGGSFAWDLRGQPYSYDSYGAPVVGHEIAGSRSSVYRFHLDSPIPFTRSLKATIERGHGNGREDRYSSVAYWYQAEPHAKFPQLPAVADRLPEPGPTYQPAP